MRLPTVSVVVSLTGVLTPSLTVTVAVTTALSLHDSVSVDACVPAPVLECACNAASNLLLTSTSINRDTDIEHITNCDGMPLRRHEPVVADCSYNNTTLTRFTEREGLRVARIRKAFLVTRRMVMSEKCEMQPGLLDLRGSERRVRLLALFFCGETTLF